jgi:hypothetical protein
VVRGGVYEVDLVSDKLESFPNSSGGHCYSWNTMFFSYKYFFEEKKISFFFCHNVHLTLHCLGSLKSKLRESKFGRTKFLFTLTKEGGVVLNGECLSFMNKSTNTSPSFLWPVIWSILERTCNEMFIYHVFFTSHCVFARPNGNATRFTGPERPSTSCEVPGSTTPTGNPYPVNR